MQIDLPFTAKKQKTDQNDASTNNEIFVSPDAQLQPDVITLFITGPLDIEYATDICSKLKAVEMFNRLNKTLVPIELIINSPGGDLHAGWMICDIINNMKTPVQTIGYGQVASAGLLIFMTGLKGFRIATPNTNFMSHRFIASTEASHQDLKSQQTEWDRTHQRIIDHYCRCTGLPEKRVERELLPEHNVWMSAEDALQLNICDAIDYKRNQPDKLFEQYNNPKKRKKSK